MAIITLPGNTLGCCIGTGSFESVGKAFSNAKTTTNTLKQSLSELKSKVDVAKVAANVDTVFSNAQNSEKRESSKASALTAGYGKLEEFISDIDIVDTKSAHKIRERKNDFYARYSYLKPECEKSTREKIKEKIKGAAEWCCNHWKEILATLVIVVGAVIAVVAVIASGGMALVPILTSLLTTIGISAGTAMTIATVVSLTVATIAVLSTIASSTLNIIDTWENVDNPTFNKWQSALNVISFVSNGLYSIGGIYNGLKGITNANLRNYGKSWITNPQFRSAVSGASKYSYNLQPNTATFWSGLGDMGSNNQPLYNGDKIAANCAEKMGRTSLERTLEVEGITLPEWTPNPNVMNAWNSASSSFAMQASGDVRALMGNVVREKSVWNVFEKTILGVNPKVTSLTIYTPSSITTITNMIQCRSVFSGIMTALTQSENLFKEWN